MGKKTAMTGTFTGGTTRGIGVGGMERLADYPGALWILMIGIIAVLSAGARAGHHAATRSR